MQLIPYLEMNYGLSDQVLQEIDKASVTKQHGKKCTILEAGNYAKNIFFIEKGLVRLFYFKGGKAITHYFLRKVTLSQEQKVHFYSANLFTVSRF